MGPPHFETLARVADRLKLTIWCLEVTAEQIGFAAARQIFAIRRIVEPKSATAKASDEISWELPPSMFPGPSSKTARLS